MTLLVGIALMGLLVAFLVLVALMSGAEQPQPLPVSSPEQLSSAGGAEGSSLP